MDELIQRVSDQAGLSSEVSRQVVGILLTFLNRNAPEDDVRLLLDKLPGAEPLLQSEAAESGGSPGLLGGFVDMLSGGDGVMSAFNELTAAGLDMGQIQASVKAFIAFAREKLGDEPVDRIVAKLPALNRIL